MYVILYITSIFVYTNIYMFVHIYSYHIHIYIHYTPYMYRSNIGGDGGVHQLTGRELQHQD